MKSFHSHFLVIAFLVGIGSISLAENSIRPASVPNPENLAGGGGSFSPCFSADGLHIAFVSYANNLATNDDLAPYLDVFVRDLTTRTTTLVSANASGRGGGNGNSNDPMISSNGQYVVFASEADNLVPNDTNRASDVFVRDVASGKTTLVSVNRTGGASVRRVSSRPVMTPDGRWVVFQSTADDLSETVIPNNQVRHLYARDLQAGKTYLVSAPVDLSDFNALPPGAESHSAVIAADGARVAFVSTLTNLVSGGRNPLGDIFVRDLVAMTNYWVSVNLTNIIGLATNRACFNPVMSADGRYVAFKAATINQPGQVYLFYHDLSTGETREITRNSLSTTWPSMDSDGRLVAYEAFTNIYVWDAQTGSNLLASVSASANRPGAGISQAPVLTPDGGHIAFLSTATDLVSGISFKAGGGFQLFVRDLAAGTNCLANAGLFGQSDTLDLEFVLPVLSPDGRRVAFESLDPAFVSNDLNQASDVFVRDVALNTTELVSQRASTLPAGTGASSSRLDTFSVSGNGQFVAFTSFDNNLAAGDTNRLRDVFMRDLAKGVIIPVSVDSQGAFLTNYGAIEPVVNAAGDKLLFMGASYFPDSSYERINPRLYYRDVISGITEQLVTNVVFAPIFALSSQPAIAISGDGQFAAFSAYLNTSKYQMVLRDLTARTNLLVSSSRIPWQSGGDGDSVYPLFSPDGQWLVFHSTATDLLVSNPVPGNYQKLFARHLYSNTTHLVSSDLASLVSLGYTATAFTPSGRYLTFYGNFTNLTSSFFERMSFIYDFLTRTAAVVCTSCVNSAASDNGRWVAFEKRLEQARASDIVLKDMQSGQETLISANYSGTGGGNGFSTSPLISADGRFVVFASTASNLVASDTNNASDIFVYDRVLANLMLISRNRQGTASGNGVSSKPVMADDGRTVVFQSFASDLIDGDYNDASDIFVLRLGAGDSDNDGLPDDWEITFFGDLSRDGSGDDDGDGQIDRQEYLAGTDPTNQGSVFRVLTLTAVNAGPAILLWSAVPGKTYQVQYKNRVEEPWATLPGIIIAAGSTASALDTLSGAATGRFYRVLLVQ